MGTVVSWFKKRPLRFIGGFVVFFSLGLLVFLVLLDIIAGTSNPYLGVITYMVLPGVLAFGLVLVPIDGWIQRRRIARGEPAVLALDFSNAAVRKVAMFFAGSSMFILVAMTVASYKGVEYMDTKDFCGRVCHNVMMPEYTAYTRSAHASVACTQCHIGPGASWFVRSKLSGIPQVWHYTRGDYPRPLETPVQALRPSRDTCENCHNPTHFYGGRLVTAIKYDPDEKNTKHVLSMVMNVGSGGVPGSGIHSHMVNTITYLPGKKDNSAMEWVKVERPDGSSQEFVNSEHKGELGAMRKQFKTRRMDCIDCHNRAAHDFDSYDTLINNAMTRRDIDPTLPFIKKETAEAVGDEDKVPSADEQKAIAAKIDQIVDFYKKNYPDLFKSREADIRKAVKTARDLYVASAWPHMRVNSKTYKSWTNMTDGCNRCHGAMEATKPGGKRPNIPADNCALCHTDQKDEIQK